MRSVLETYLRLKNLCMRVVHFNFRKAEQQLARKQEQLNRHREVQENFKVDSVEKLPDDSAEAKRNAELDARIERLRKEIAEMEKTGEEKLREHKERTERLRMTLTEKDGEIRMMLEAKRKLGEEIERLRRENCEKKEAKEKEETGVESKDFEGTGRMVDLRYAG